MLRPYVFPMPDDRFTSAALHTFALVAALRTALGVSHGIAARRAGEDPTEEEPEAPVRAYLDVAAARIGSRLVRLRLRAVAGPPEEPHAALVQAFEDRLALADLAEELRVTHQKLLSLYPAVGEALVETARQRHHEALGLVEEDAPTTPSHPSWSASPTTSTHSAWPSWNGRETAPPGQPVTAPRRSRKT